jgi:SAM-dependent methyltransferase
VERETAHRETERAAALALPSLSDLATDLATDLADDTSLAVAAQYEANPYPRWLRLTKPDGGAYTDYLRTFLADSERARFQGPFSVLVAGCGTGEQAVAAALGYGTRASVTGVDLSRPSLAYGARRARDYDMSNLTFIHGDILDLDGLAGHADLWGRADRVGQTDLGDRTVSGDRTGRTGQFDLIECIGVLHHMADPRAGWRKLTDRLAPGGAMLIGLYSAAARQHITDLRDRMQGTTADIAPDTIRAFRSGLLDAPDSDERQLIVATPEFYSLSSCRDLLFHTHEQPVTVPWIADSLDQLGLKFRGFLLPDARLARFRLEHPDANPTRDLAAWSNFEDSYPRTFAGMYQFWCHKPG